MTGYINILTNSFGTFQFFFRKLILIIPIFVLIAGFIYLFYFLIKK